MPDKLANNSIDKCKIGRERERAKKENLGLSPPLWDASTRIKYSWQEAQQQQQYRLDFPPAPARKLRPTSVADVSSVQLTNPITRNTDDGTTVSY